MPDNRSLLSPAQKTCAVAAFELRHKRFDTAGFFDSLSAAKFLILSERKYIKLSNALSVILERCEVLYFSQLEAFSSLQKLPKDALSEIYTQSSALSQRTLLLCDALQNQTMQEFRRKQLSIYADAEAFEFFARKARFLALSKHQSINRALPEIEYICKCSDSVKRAIRLLNSYCGVF